MITFQQVLRQLAVFWEKQGCIIHQGYDLEVGAGTFNPATFLRCLGPEPYRAAYIEPSRRPSDGRYGTNPNRLQHYFQFQVVLKPSPSNIQELYLQSLEALGFDLLKHDIRFVHDDWENPTIGAWGLGWELWMDGMEVGQFTYFQAVGGVELKPVTGEITYGIERLAMYLQQVNSIFDLQWNEDLTYGDIYHRSEVEWSHYNFTKANTEMWQRHFEDYEREAKRLIQENFPIPAYDFVIKASHAFNILDSRGVISVTERTGYIGRIRDLARQVAEEYMNSRKTLGYPLLNKFKTNKKETTILPHLSKELLNAKPEESDDFLFEIGSEELPATFVGIGSRNLENNLRTLLEKEGISFKKVTSYSTPRRLAVYIQELAKGKPAQSTEKKGPSVEQAFAHGTVTPAGEGFFRSIGIQVSTLDAIKQQKVSGVEIRAVKDIPYLFGTIKHEGKATASILQEQLPSLILNLEFPKKMRWGDSEITYARPLKWIIALFGKEVIPFQIGEIISGKTTFGHRQLTPNAFDITSPGDYVNALRQANVMVDPIERKGQILAQLKELEKESGGKIIEADRVIPQVLNLVEWPFLTIADFQHHFLKAPQEVLISEMVEHQKYFPVTDQKGKLINKFVITANIPPTDNIRNGNQRVLSARLSDGIFLYEEDLKLSMEDFNEKLKKVTFQKELGTVYQKVERIRGNAKVIQKILGISSPAKVDRAALLSKADLASNMVYEFPELQGTIGKYYAQAHEEDPEVAIAIDEHWMPRGENAPLPKTETGAIISLSDKLDNLIGCFAIGLKPTSSSDPYALRRQVLGMIKILINDKFELPLKETIHQCMSHFPKGIIKDPNQVVDDLLAFMTNRIKTVFLDYGFNKDEIEASLSSGTNDIYDTFCRVKALHEFRLGSKQQFDSLFEVYKRAKGQLEQGENNVKFHEERLTEPAEKSLYSILSMQNKPFLDALEKRKYNEAYSQISAIQQPLADLFDNVKILADDPKLRENRLALLKHVFGLFGQILDFSKISKN